MCKSVNGQGQCNCSDVPFVDIWKATSAVVTTVALNYLMGPLAGSIVAYFSSAIRNGVFQMPKFNWKNEDDRIAFEMVDVTDGTSSKSMDDLLKEWEELDKAEKADAMLDSYRNREGTEIVNALSMAGQLIALFKRLKIIGIIGLTENLDEFLHNLKNVYKCYCGNNCKPTDPDDPEPKLVMSPIILDLDGDTSNDVTPLADSAAYFDMKSWGVANRTGWVSPTDGLLAWDRNGNGSIDDSSELFGNTESANGFEQLRKYFDTNKDGVVDANDTNFGELKV